MAPPSLSAVASVGLEIHVRLLTPTKLFCACPNKFGTEANARVCPVCLGLPGALPVTAPAAVEQTVRLALGLGSTVHRESVFARKHYFYPDLPRNYQITQHERPLATGGTVELAGRSVRIRRVHLEEDAGRSQRHADGGFEVDLDRAGAPLAEIVTEPDLNNGSEARAWLGELRRLLLFLGVTDGRMQAGSLRCDANVGWVGGPVLSELKNLNSFRALGRAVDQEISRLSGECESGRQPERTTRSWDEAIGRTRPLRPKESVPDYRYLVEPDLPPLVVGARMQEEVLRTLPPAPGEHQRRLVAAWGLPEAAAEELCCDPVLLAFYEDVLGELGAEDPADAALAATWVRTEVIGHGNDGEGGFVPPLTARRLARILALLDRGRINGTVAKRLVAGALAGDGRPPGEVVEAEGWEVIDDPEQVDDLCRRALADHPDEAAAWRSGRHVLTEFFMGRVQALGGGRVRADLARSALTRRRQSAP